MTKVQVNIEFVRILPFFISRKVVAPGALRKRATKEYSIPETKAAFNDAPPCLPKLLVTSAERRSLTGLARHYIVPWWDS